MAGYLGGGEGGDQIEEVERGEGEVGEGEAVAVCGGVLPGEKGTETAEPVGLVPFNVECGRFSGL